MLLHSLQILPATFQDHPLIQQMARFYVYDLSRSCDFTCPKDGLFECFDLTPYFQKNHRPFLFQYQKEWAGFALIHPGGTHSNTQWTIAEFFILAKFQSKGLGRHIALELFHSLSPAQLEITLIPENKPALSFWRRVLDTYCQFSYSQSLTHVQHPSPHSLLVLRFSSPPTA